MNWDKITVTTIHNTKIEISTRNWTNISTNDEINKYNKKKEHVVLQAKYIYKLATKIFKKLPSIHSTLHWYKYTRCTSRRRSNTGKQQRAPYPDHYDDVVDHYFLNQDMCFAGSLPSPRRILSEAQILCSTDQWDCSVEEWLCSTDQSLSPVEERVLLNRPITELCWGAGVWRHFSRSRRTSWLILHGFRSLGDFLFCEFDRYFSTKRSLYCAKINF